MAVRGEQIGQREVPPPTGTAAELVEHLSRFEGPPQAFLAELLAVQCRLASASGGAFLRGGAGGRAEVLAASPAIPEGGTAPAWLAQAVPLAPKALAADGTTVQALHAADDLYGQPARRSLIFIPVRDDQGTRGLAVFHVATPSRAALVAARERLELSISLLSLYEMRLSLQQRQGDLARLRRAMEVVAALNEQQRFAGAAMACCNEIAARWKCERAALGFLKGRYVQLKALSHTEKFSRKMKLVQDIEAAMEECLDQDAEIVHPSPPEAPIVNRAAQDLARRHGPSAVVSLPLRQGGEPVAVLTAERRAEEPFAAEEVETHRLTGEQCTARLENLHRQDRWFGAKAAAAARRGVAFLLGAKHTWAKLIALVVFACVVFLVFARGDYNAGGTFVLESRRREFVSAPFAGVLSEVKVEPDDAVAAGQLLGKLDTEDLEAALEAANTKRTAFLMEASVYRRDGKYAEAAISEQRGEEVRQGEIEPLKRKVAESRLTAPFAGTVVSESLKRQVGTAVEKGKALFEVAELAALRAEVFVPEDQIAEVRLGQPGELTFAAYTQRRIPFTVEWISPVAEVEQQQNVFRVRVRLETSADWMSPGMKGAARIHIDRRRYAWIWSRRLVNWLRMKLWW